MAGDDAKTELCFLDVPAPQSAHVVEQLTGKPGLEMAAAIYSGVDVVALVEGSEAEVEEAYRILAPESTLNIDGFERFPADRVIRGPSFASREILLHSACTAFVRCAIRTDEVPVSWATSVLTKLPGVTRLFPNEDLGEVVLEVVAPDKQAFDDLIMSSIQGRGDIVQSTRTFLLINALSWKRGPEPDQSPIFISTAKQDVDRALWLGERIHTDTGLSCWTYRDIPIGTEPWTKCIDEAIEAALMKIFLLSKDSLSSEECQREFGRAEATTDSNNICCLLLPGCEISDLPTRYRQRQCLPSADISAYPLLLDWIRGCLKGSPA
jgi:TIR domain